MTIESYLNQYPVYIQIVADPEDLGHIVAVLLDQSSNVIVSGNGDTIQEAMDRLLLNHEEYDFRTRYASAS